MKKKQTLPQLLSAYRNLSISAIYDLSDSEALIFLKMLVGEILTVFIRLSVLVVRLHIKPIFSLLASNGSASIANIVFL